MELRGLNGTRRVAGGALFALICAMTLGLGTAAATADTSDSDGTVLVAAPASNQCDGPGCAADDQGTSMFAQLLGNGPGCADGGACFWVQTDFDGDKARVDDVACCQWFQPTGVDRFRSAKNRYVARKVLTGNAGNVTSCMDPGESRSDLEASDRVRVGAVGSSC